MRLGDGSVRKGQVLEVDGTKAVVQVGAAARERMGAHAHSGSCMLLQGAACCLRATAWDCL